MMRAGILRSREGWHIEQLEDALSEHGIEHQKFSITDLALAIDSKPAVSSDGIDIGAFDFIIVRIIPSGSLEQIMFRMNTLRCVENLGVRVINSSEAIEKTVDKSYTSHLLANAGLPTPKTFVCERLRDAMKAFETMRDVIVKPLYGSCGVGMTRVTDREIAYRIFRSLEQNGFIFYLQEFVENHGHDLRLFVVNGEVAGAIKRTGIDWKNNCLRGARAEPYTPANRQVDLAIQAADILGLDYAGVDLIAGKDGIDYIIEVNGIPGWRKLQESTGINIAEKLVRFVKV